MHPVKIASVIAMFMLLACGQPVSSQSPSSPTVQLSAEPTRSPSNDRCLFLADDVCPPESEDEIRPAGRVHVDPVLGFALNVPSGWAMYQDYTIRYSPDASRLVQFYEGHWPDDFVNVDVSSSSMTFDELKDEQASFADEDEIARQYETTLGGHRVAVFELRDGDARAVPSIVYVIAWKARAIKIRFWVDRRRAHDEFRPVVEKMIGSIQPTAQGRLGRRVEAFLSSRLEGSGAESFLSTDVDGEIDQRLYGWMPGTSIDEWELLYAREVRDGMLLDLDLGYSCDTRAARDSEDCGPRGRGGFWERFFIDADGFVRAGDTIREPGTS